MVDIVPNRLENMAEVVSDIELVVELCVRACRLRLNPERHQGWHKVSDGQWLIVDGIAEHAHREGAVWHDIVRQHFGELGLKEGVPDVPSTRQKYCTERRDTLARRSIEHIGLSARVK